MPEDERPELFGARSKPARRDAARQLYFDARADWDCVLDNLPELCPYLRDPDPVVRGHVTGAIGYVIFAGPERKHVDNWADYRQQLFGRLSDPDQRVRQTALGLMQSWTGHGEYDHTDKRLIAEGLAICMRDDSEIVRSRAATHASASNLKHHPAFAAAALPPFVAALDADHGEVRRGAAETLWDCVTDESLDCSTATAELAEQVRSTKTETRALAARALCPLWVDDPERVDCDPVEILLECLQSDADMPRRTLVETVEWLLETAPESVETLDPVVDQFGYPDTRLRQAVGRALVTATTERPEIAPAVAETLAEQSTDTESRRFSPLEMLAESHPEVVSRAVTGLFENIAYAERDTRRPLDVVESIGANVPAIVEQALPVAFEQLSAVPPTQRDEIARTLGALLSASPDHFQQAVDPLIDAYPTFSASKADILSGLLSCDPEQVDPEPAVEQFAADVLSNDKSVRAHAATILVQVQDSATEWAGALAEYVDGTAVPDAEQWPLGVVATADADIVDSFLSELAGELLDTGTYRFRRRDQLEDALHETLAGDPAAVDGAIQTLADGIEATANTKEVLEILTVLAKKVPERLGPVVGPLAEMAPNQHWGTCRNMVEIVATVSLAAPEAVSEHLYHLGPLLEDSHERTRRYTAAAFAAAGAHDDPVRRARETLSAAIADPEILVHSEDGYVYAEVAETYPEFVEDRLRSMVTHRTGRGEPFYELLEAVAAVHPPIIEVIATALATQLQATDENRRFCIETLGLIAQDYPDAVAPHVEPMAANLDAVPDRVARTVTAGLATVAEANPSAMRPALPDLTALFDTNEYLEHLKNAVVAVAHFADEHPDEVLAAFDATSEAKLQNHDASYVRYLGDRMAGELED